MSLTQSGSFLDIETPYNAQINLDSAIVVDRDEVVYPACDSPTLVVPRDDRSDPKNHHVSNLGDVFLIRLSCDEVLGQKDVAHALRKQEDLLLRPRIKIALHLSDVFLDL